MEPRNIQTIKVSSKSSGNEEDQAKVTIWEFGLPPFTLMVRVNDNCFKVHQSKLANAGRYLKKLIKEAPISSSKPNVKELTINNCNASAFGVICIWLYLGECHITKENYNEVLETAEQLRIPDVQQLCKEFSDQSISDFTFDIQPDQKAMYLARKLDMKTEAHAVLRSHKNERSPMPPDQLPNASQTYSKSSILKSPNRQEDIVINVHLDDLSATNIGNKLLQRSPRLVYILDKKAGRPASFRDNLETPSTSSAVESSEDSIQSDSGSCDGHKTSDDTLVNRSPHSPLKHHDQHTNVSIRSSELAAILTSDFSILISKALLKRKSKYFQEILRKGNGDNIINLEESDPVIVVKMIKWLKYGNCEMSIWDVTDLARLACRCHLTKLFAECQDYMRFLVVNMSEELVTRGLLSESDLPIVKYFFEHSDNQSDQCWQLMDHISSVVSTWDKLPKDSRMCTKDIPTIVKTETPLSTMAPNTLQPKQSISWRKHKLEESRKNASTQNNVENMRDNRKKVTASTNEDKEDSLPVEKDDTTTTVDQQFGFTRTANKNHKNLTLRLKSPRGISKQKGKAKSIKIAQHSPGGTGAIPRSKGKSFSWKT